MNAFIDQMTRKLIVGWADHQVQHGCIPENIPKAYFKHALAKGWISKKDHTKLNALGWKTAVSFLKR